MVIYIDGAIWQYLWVDFHSNNQKATHNYGNTTSSTSQDTGWLYKVWRREQIPSGRGSQVTTTPGPSEHQHHSAASGSAQLVLAAAVSPPRARGGVARYIINTCARTIDTIDIIEYRYWVPSATHHFTTTPENHFFMNVLLSRCVVGAWNDARNDCQLHLYCRIIFYNNVDR